MKVLCPQINNFFYGGREKFQKKVIGELMKTLEVGSNVKKIQIYRSWIKRSDNNGPKDIHRGNQDSKKRRKTGDWGQKKKKQCISKWWGVQRKVET